MTDDGSSEHGEQPVPDEVAQAARLWVSDRRISEPEYAAWANRFTWLVLRRLVVVGLVAAIVVFAALKAISLIGMLVIATFFALAIIPGVNTLQRKYNMRRGSAVAIVYLIAITALILLVAVLLPAVVKFADAVQGAVGGWVQDLNTWAESVTGGPVLSEEQATASVQAFMDSLATWGGNVFGIVTTGLGFIFDFFTIAAFTFYIAVGFPNLRRALMTRMPPERQRVFAWITDQSIEQTGGYFYSRMLLMIVNGGLGFAVMLVLGMPVVYALPMALFMGFVSEFIPFIGTYIGAAIPIALMLVTQGLVPAVLMLVWVIIYQQIENYWLSPRFSSQTMELNGAVAFGSAIAGGAIAGPMGAFMALPVAALITAVAKNAGRTYALVVDDLDGPELKSPGQRSESREHSRWQFWRK